VAAAKTAERSAHPIQVMLIWYAGGTFAVHLDLI
jgi:hypothetical protein